MVSEKFSFHRDAGVMSKVHVQKRQYPAVGPRSDGVYGPDLQTTRLASGKVDNANLTAIHATIVLDAIDDSNLKSVRRLVQYVKNADYARAVRFIATGADSSNAYSLHRLAIGAGSRDADSRHRGAISTDHAKM